MNVNKSFISVALILFATVSVLGCKSCSQSTVDGCKAGVSALTGAGCAVGSAVGGALCGITLGFGCLFGAAIVGAACGPDWQSCKLKYISTLTFECSDERARRKSSKHHRI